MVGNQKQGSIEQLIAHGQAALANGNMYEARKWFRMATEQYPESGAAWFGLAQSVFPYTEKRDYLLRALALEPNNSEARQQLEEVEQQIAAGAVMAPRPSPPSSSAAANAGSQPISGVPAVDVAVAVTCIHHPGRETGLRCAQCEAPICSECATSAFVGQLCPACARQRRPINYQVSALHLVTAGSLSLIVAGISSFLAFWTLSVTGFLGLLLTLFFASLTAELLIRMLDYVTRAKRGKAMQVTVGISIGVGTLPLLLLVLFVAPFHFHTLLLVAFAALLISTTVYRLR